MNLQETHILRKPDNKVELDGERIIGTQHGNITVRKVAENTYFAVLHASGFELTFSSGMASTAFLKLAEKIKANNYEVKNAQN